MKNFNHKLGPAIFFILGVLGVASSTTASEPKKIWEVSGFMSPESAVYDARRNIVFVSNINGSGTEKDGNGFISTLKPDGTVIKMKWAEGLNAPKGMVISGDKIYVSDIDRLVEIEIDRGSISGRWTAKDAIFLNDTAVDSSGRVYVSDMLNNTIYRLANNNLTSWVSGAGLQGPNGLTIEGDNLRVATWGVITEGFSTSVAGHLKTVALASGKISSMGDGSTVGHLDGLEPIGDNAYLVTDWVGGGLYRIHSSGKADLLLDLNQGSADHEYIDSKNLVIIPMMLDGKVVAYEVK